MQDISKGILDIFILFHHSIVRLSALFYLTKTDKSIIIYTYIIITFNRKELILLWSIMRSYMP